MPTQPGGEMVVASTFAAAEESRTQRGGAALTGPANAVSYLGRFHSAAGVEAEIGRQIFWFQHSLAHLTPGTPRRVKPVRATFGACDPATPALVAGSRCRVGQILERECPLS